MLEEPFVLSGVGSDTANAMQEALGGRLPRIAMQIASNETIKQAVMAGMGISFISLHTVMLELATGKLVTLNVAGLPVMREWFVIHLRDKKLSPIATAFHSFLRERGAKIRQAALTP